MAVHIYELPVDMAPVEALVKKSNLKLIEDATQAIGQTCYVKPCGIFEDVSTFSFYPSKRVTASEGDMVLSEDDETAEVCKSLRNICFNKRQRFVHEQFVWNYRMTNFQVAIGLAQLENSERIMSRKLEIGRFYFELIRHYEVEHFVPPQLRRRFALITFTGYTRWLWVNQLKISGTSLLSYQTLAMEQGVFYPLDRQPVLRNRPDVRWATCLNAFDAYDAGC